MELVVATAVTGVLIIMIMTFAINSFAQISIDSARGDLLREAQISLDTLTQDVRLSSNSYETSNILDPNAPGGTQHWAGSSEILVLATAAQDKDKNILFADALQYTSHKNIKVYFVQDKTLYRRTLALDVPNNAATTTCPVASNGCPSDSLLAHNVKELAITYLDGNGDEVDPNSARSIEAKLVLEQRKYNRNIRAEYKTRTVFRNE